MTQTNKATSYTLYRAGLSNLLAMAGHTDFILGVAGQYAILVAIKAMFECEENLLWREFTGLNTHQYHG